MSSAKYRLPQSLGGAVVTGEPTEDGSAVWVTTNDATFQLPMSLLTVVRPPQPLGGWVIVHLQIEVPQVFYRNPGWDPNRWLHVNEGVNGGWDDVCALGDPIQLVVKKSEYGRCTVCRELKPVRVDGMVKEHGGRHRPCKGSSLPPDREADR